MSATQIMGLLIGFIIACAIIGWLASDRREKYVPPVPAEPTPEPEKQDPHPELPKVTREWPWGEREDRVMLAGIFKSLRESAGDWESEEGFPRIYIQYLKHKPTSLYVREDHHTEFSCRSNCSYSQTYWTLEINHGPTVTNPESVAIYEELYLEVTGVAAKRRKQRETFTKLGEPTS